MAFTSITTNPGTGGVTLASQTYSGLVYPASTLVYGPDGGAFNLVGVNQPLPVSVGDGQKATYSASITGLVPLTGGATDLFELNNSAGTKILKVTRVSLVGTAGTAVDVPVSLVKRSTLNSAGTSSTPTVVPHDSSDSAGTGVVKAYTANPTTGSLVGAVRNTVINLPTSGTATGIVWNFGGSNDPNTRAITLRANQSLCINFNTTAITSGLVYIEITWTEE